MYLSTNKKEIVMQARETYKRFASAKESSNEKFYSYERVWFGTFDKNKCCIHKSDFPFIQYILYKVDPQG